ncbi:hypothetical protein GCM10019996_23190 [Lentilactobacillus parakefiri]
MNKQFLTGVITFVSLFFSLPVGTPAQANKLAKSAAPEITVEPKTGISTSTINASSISLNSFQT